LALVGESRIASDYDEPANSREGGDNLLDHAVGQIILLEVAVQIGKGQNGDRRLIGHRQGLYERGCPLRRPGQTGQPIASAWYGHNVTVTVAAIGKGSAQCRDIDIEVALLDNVARP
jgi:hypothetical protein